MASYRPLVLFLIIPEDQQDMFGRILKTLQEKEIGGMEEQQGVLEPEADYGSQHDSEAQGACAQGAGAGEAPQVLPVQEEEEQ